MNGDRMNRAATAAAVLLVALIAAVVSFVHIQQLARHPRADAPRGDAAPAVDRRHGRGRVRW